MPTIHTKRSADEVQQDVGRLGSILAGHEADPTGGMMAAMLEELGDMALALISDSFIHLSQSGVSSDGRYWEPLKEKTVAYSRDHPGLVRKHPLDRPRGLLSAKQDKRWRGIFQAIYYSLVRTYYKSPVYNKEAAGNAAAYAWQVLKSEGARTILAEYGRRVVDILQASGDLLESLTPHSGSSHQIFERGLGTVIVGSKLPYAGAHHRGNPSKNLPARPLWPDPANLPQEWQDKFMEIIAKYCGLMLQRMMSERSQAA